jgi:hypothetical protein
MCEGPDNGGCTKSGVALRDLLALRVSPRRNLALSFASHSLRRANDAALGCLAPPSMPDPLRHRRAVDMATLILVAFIALAVFVPPAEAEVKSLSYADLVSGGVALGGVTTMIGDSISRRDNRFSMTDVVLTSFRARRGDLVLDGTDRVRAALGEEAYGSMLDHFERTAQLDPQSRLALAADSLGFDRYLMLARVEETDVDCDHEKAPPEENPVYSHTLETEEMEIVTVDRKVTVRFRIFDLRNGTLVWDTRHSKKVSIRDKVPKETRIFKGGSIAGMLEGTLSNHPGDPPAPPVTSVLSKVAEKFAKKLPQKKKK